VVWPVFFRDDQDIGRAASRQVKVLFIVTAFPRGDGDVITPWLVQTIHRLRARGVVVEVLAPSYRGLPDQLLDGVKVHRFRYAPAAWETLTHDQTAPDRIRQRPMYAALLPGYLVMGSLAAARLARSGEFDVVHAFWPLPHALLGLAARRVSGVPLVSTFFGVELTWVASQLRPLRPLLRRIIRGSDAVTAISTYTAGLMKELAPGVEPAIIPFGAAIEAPGAGTGTAPADPAHFGLLFVGRLVERKGVHVLLEALARLPDRIRLDIVGDGPERERLKALAQRLGISGRVAFHGFAPDEMLRALLGWCDALVLPAVVDAKGDVEGLGVVLLEAMSFGKPVIASAAGGITDIVRDGENGLLVPPADPAALARAIDSLAGDPETARRFGSAAREDVARRFSWDAILDRLVELYERLAPRRADTGWGGGERI
jgi:glycosyltransferase involved in cell wall biosynthesis